MLRRGIQKSLVWHTIAYIFDEFLRTGFPCEQLRWNLKQGLRFLLHPGQFFNQLQWSRHHWYILFAFFIISGIEAQVGKQHSLYQVYANLIGTQTGIGMDLALWLVVAAKIFLLLGGSFLLVSVVWMVGNFIGQRNSRRVLARRLAVVFTVALAAYTAHHLEHYIDWMQTASFFLYFWAFLLGYFALREQFALTHMETAFMGVFTVFLVATSWHYSNRFFEKTAERAIHEIAAKPMVRSGAKVAPRY